ncbi:helix-turn-helix domain-containing protein [Halomonas cerina]
MQRCVTHRFGVAARDSYQAARLLGISRRQLEDRLKKR